MNKSNSNYLIKTGKAFNYVAMLIVAIGWVIPICAGVIHFLILAANNFGYDGKVIFDNWQEAQSLALAFFVCFPLYRFFQRLQKIIDSVASQSVFEMANADHLKAMGWYFLASQAAVTLATAANFMWSAGADERELLENSIELFLTLPSYLLVVVLFILAEVFRHGAAMREDLEGTV
jgi:hypothetical protein